MEFVDLILTLETGFMQCGLKDRALAWESGDLTSIPGSAAG